MTIMNVMRMDPETKQAIDKLTYRTLRESGCGVCEKEGGDVFWPNHKSSVAHQHCFQRIKEIQLRLVKHIQEMYHHMPAIEKTIAYRRAIHAVRITCREPLIVFLDKHGKEELSKVFDTAGISAASRRVSRL